MATLITKRESIKYKNKEKWNKTTDRVDIKMKLSNIVNDLLTMNLKDSDRNIYCQLLLLNLPQKKTPYPYGSFLRSMNYVSNI